MKSQVATTMSINESDQALSSGRLISNAPHSYTMLKEKYAQLSNDYEHLQNAYNVLERKNDTEERHFIAEMEKLCEAKNAAIANFQSYTVESEQRIKQIKEQLDEQYRNNFELLKFEVEKFKLENEQLEEQRIQLQRQIVEQNAELRKIKRENEEREIQIRNTYEEQINKLIDDLLIVHRKSVEDGTNQAEVDILRERYRSLNERYHQLHEDSERRQYENDSKIQRLETEILEHTLRGTRSAIHLQQ
uniref:Transforming acidic coiled-coil-containing protein C-terminal domain-containing protein n=1 Tax=Ascaris lumbricoides TaxID=6252 RepID=A0A9J2PR64_ASCLU